MSVTVWSDDGPASVVTCVASALVVCLNVRFVGGFTGRFGGSSTAALSGSFALDFVARFAGGTSGVKKSGAFRLELPLSRCSITFL